MKKSIIIAVMLLMTFSAKAQWFNFSNNNERAGAGFHIGLAGWHCEYQDVGIGFSLNVLGGYIDFIKAGPEHKFDKHLSNTMYNDSVALLINAGYQIPVLPWLRIMPLVGYCQTNAGLTDATSYNVEYDDYNARIYHDYDVTPGTRKHYFNVGAGIFVQPIKWVEIYAIGSTHGIYGGLNFDFGIYNSVFD